MTTSGTYAFTMDNASLLVEAFDRIQRPAASLTAYDMASARRSMNLELQTWSNKGINLWEVMPWTLQIVAGQATYTAGAGVTNIPAQCQIMLDVYFSTINGGGAGVNLDRIMIPMSRTQYAELPNKAQAGQPNMYWYQKLEVPQITFWQPPIAGYPTYAISGYCLTRIQDANAVASETPDVPYRFLDALCAGTAKRLAQKFRPELFEGLKAEALESFNEAAFSDREDTPIVIRANIGRYWAGRR